MGMARAGIFAAPRGAWILWLLWFLVSWERDDAHYLYYNITVLGNQNGYKAQGQVDQETFLHCDSSNDKCKPVGTKGKKVTDTEAWAKQPETLKDMAEICQQLLADIKLENAKSKEPCTLLCRMSCTDEDNGKTSGSWQFVYNGQEFLRFDSNSRKWTEVHGRHNWTTEIFEDDLSLNDFLARTSEGDCVSWMKQFLGSWEEMLQATAPPTPNKSSRITLSNCVLLVLLCIILVI